MCFRKKNLKKLSFLANYSCEKDNRNRRVFGQLLIIIKSVRLGLNWPWEVNHFPSTIFLLKVVKMSTQFPPLNKFITIVFLYIFLIIFLLLKGHRFRVMKRQGNLIFSSKKKLYSLFPNVTFFRWFLNVCLRIWFLVKDTGNIFLCTKNQVRRLCVGRNFI